MRPFTSIAIAALLSTAVHAQSTNVVTNGSFEQHRCSQRVGFGCMTGWTATPQSASNIVWIRSQASDGKVAVELDADDAPIYLSQTVQVLPQQLYTLQFDMAGQTRAPATIAMRVRVNGVTHNVSVPGSSAYKTYSFQFTPTTNSTEIRFWNATQTNFPVSGALLDDVRVSALPSSPGRRLFEAYGDGYSRSGGYGTSIAVVGDVDKDQVPDIAVGEPAGGLSFSGLIDLLSGKTGRRIRRLVPGTGDSGIGVHVTDARDIDGDGVRDILTASARRVSIYSGANGSVLRSFNVAGAAGVAGVGDWNNDLFRDVAWVASGVLHIASGKDGSTLATITGLGASDVVALGTDIAIVGSRGVQCFRRGATQPAWTVAGYASIADAGDFNRDLRLEVIARSATATDVLSGVDGKLIRRFPAGTSARGRFDLTGDFIPDIVIGDRRANGGAGLARTYSGSDGKLLWEYAGHERSDSFGWDVASHPSAGSTARKAMIVSVLSRFNGSVDAGSVLAVAQAVRGELDGWIRPFGPHCDPQNQRIRPGTLLPTVGKQYSFRFDSNTRPQGFMVLVVGSSRTKWNGITLPITLPGTMGCKLLVAPDIIVPAGLSSFVSLTIPNISSLVGGEWFVQGLSFFSSTFTTSDAAGIRVGN